MAWRTVQSRFLPTRTDEWKPEVPFSPETTPEVVFCGIKQLYEPHQRCGCCLGCGPGRSGRAFRDGAVRQPGAATRVSARANRQSHRQVVRDASGTRALGIAPGATALGVRPWQCGVAAD